MTDWKKVTPPTTEQQALLDDAIHTIKTPVGWAQRKGQAYDPLLPDVQELWRKYGGEVFRDISTKSLPSDHIGASLINRQLNKELLELYLEDKGWLGDYDQDCDWNEFKTEEKMTKWQLQGIFKVLCYVLYNQMDKKHFLSVLEFEAYRKEMDSGGIEVTNELFRIFIKSKDVEPMERRKSSKSPKRAKSPKKITSTQVMNTSFSKEEIEQLARHFQGLMDVEQKPVVKGKQPGPNIVESDALPGYWEDEDDDQVYEKLEDGTYKHVGELNEDGDDLIKH